MAIEIKVPTVGESITEGTLARWLKRDGDRVEEGEALFELETDKATGEVPAPAAGVLKIQSREGETVVVGAVVGTIEEADGKATPAGRQKPKEPPPKKEVEAKPDSRAAVPPAAPLASKQPPATKSPPPTAEIPLPRPATIEVEAASPSISPPSPPPRIGERGKGGEVSAERETRKPMSRLRRTIAQRLVQAQHTAAILTTFNEADMSQVSALRVRFKDAFKEKHGVGLGFMSFFVKAAVEALKDFPEVNARIDGDDVVFPSYYDIGVAVSTERGLLVPVLRDADRLTFSQIERAINDLAGRARDGKITVDELRGGTFTITNGGVFGSLLSTPILNPPQSAILGMHAIQKRPVAVEDQIVIRPMMYLALSYDHRLIDGREAVQFLVRIKECIEDPDRLVLGL